jgi:hypothetical protein
MSMARNATTLVPGGINQKFMSTLGANGSSDY